MHCEYHDGSPARGVSARRLNRIWESLMRSRMIVVSTLACILLLGTICPRLNYAQALSPLEPPGVHARIFDRLERTIAACDPATDVQRCVLDAIWKTADVTADGNVSSAEINRLFRIVAGGTAYQTYVASYRDAETNRRSIPPLRTARERRTGRGRRRRFNRCNRDTRADRQLRLQLRRHAFPDRSSWRHGFCQFGIRVGGTT